MNINLTDEQKEILGIVDNRVDFYFKVENSVIDGYQAEEINPKTGKLEIIEKSYFDNVYELAVYTALSRYCNNGQVAFPSIPTLAKKCCCGQTSIKNAIKGLEQKGFIKKLNRKKANSAENDTNIYAIKNIEEIVSVGRNTTDVGRMATEGVGRETTGKKNNILNNNNINNKTCNMSSTENDLGINPKGYPRKDKWEKFINENLIGIDYIPEIEKSIKDYEKTLNKKGVNNPEKEIKEFLLENYNNGMDNNISLGIIVKSIIIRERINIVKKENIEIKNEIIEVPTTRSQKIDYMKRFLSTNEIKSKREEIAKDLLKEFNISENSIIERELENYLVALYNKNKYKEVV